MPKRNMNEDPLEDFEPRKITLDGVLSQVASIARRLYLPARSIVQLLFTLGGCSRKCRQRQALGDATGAYLLSRT